jgi:hypothetical protein
MKIKYYVLIAALSIGVTNAASVIVATTGDGATIAGNQARGIYDTAGTALAFGTGFTAVGGFVGGVPNFSISTGEQIGSAFTGLGSTGKFGDSSLGPQINGLFSLAGSAPILAGSSLINQPIFFVGGNGADFASSTQLLVIQFGTNFAVDAPAFNASFNLQLGDGNVVFGSESFNGSSSPLISSPLVANGASNSYQMANLVPEPSAALLGALGALGLLRRRRI